MTYTQACDEIFDLFESVCANYDYYTLTEAAEETPQENRNKASKVFNAVKTFFQRIFSFMRKLLDSCMTWIRKHCGFMDNLNLSQRIKLAEDISVCVGATKLDKKIVSDVSRSITKFPAKLYSNTFDQSVSTKCEEGAKTVAVSAGKKMPYTYKEAYNYISYIRNTVDVCTKHINTLNIPADATALSQELSMKRELLQNFSNYVNTVVTGIKEVIESGTKSEEAQNAKNNIDNRNIERRERKEHKKYEKEYADDYADLLREKERQDKYESNARKKYESEYGDLVKKQEKEQKKASRKAKRGRNDESVEYQSDDELRAYCLMEAARLLTESDDLCQADIDDIPEERPIVDDEYPAEVSGGDGYREDHLEDIKDLVDGNQKALDILTSDDDSKIIEESIMEFDF